MLVHPYPTAAWHSQSVTLLNWHVTIQLKFVIDVANSFFFYKPTNHPTKWLIEAPCRCLILFFLNSRLHPLSVRACVFLPSLDHHPPRNFSCNPPYANAQGTFTVGRLICAQQYQFFCTDEKIEALSHIAQGSFSCSICDKPFCIAASHLLKNAVEPEEIAPEKL